MPINTFRVLSLKVPATYKLLLLAQDKMWSGEDLNGDNMQIYRAYLWISDHCRVRVRVRNMVRVSIRVSVRVGVADCCIQTAGKSDKMRINHVIKTDQWRSAPQIRPLCILLCRIIANKYISSLSLKVPATDKLLLLTSTLSQSIISCTTLLHTLFTHTPY